MKTLAKINLKRVWFGLYQGKPTKLVILGSRRPVVHPAAAAGP